MSEQHRSAQVLALSGDLCLAELPSIRHRIDDAIADGARELVIDLRDVTLVTAAALRVFESTERRLAGLEGDLRIRNARPLPLRVLQITGFERLLERPVLVG